MLRGWLRWSERRRGLLADLGLLLLRVLAAAYMVVGHGWPKLSSFQEKAARFGDPIGIGPTASLALATFAEFFCAILVGLGLLTRFAALALVVNMSVAAFFAHAGHPFAKKELALLYLAIWLALLVAGPGRLSVDERLRRRLG
jgi:putative oxidoreductase